MQDWDRYQSLRAEANESWRTGQEVIQGVEVSDWHLWQVFIIFRLSLCRKFESMLGARMGPPGGSDGMVKNLTAMWETRVWSLGQEDPLEKGMAAHSSILAWRIPWTEEPGGLKSMRSQRLRQDWTTNILLSRGQDRTDRKDTIKSWPEGKGVGERVK